MPIFFTKKSCNTNTQMPLTVNGICLFWQLNGIWGVIPPPPQRSKELQKVCPWNFYQILLSIRRHEITKIFSICGLVCKLQNKITIFENATSRHANFAKLCRIVHIDISGKSVEFHIDISKMGCFTEQSVKWYQMLVCEIQNGLWNVN